MSVYNIDGNDIVGYEVIEPTIFNSTNSIFDPFEDKLPYKGKYLKNKNGELGNAATWSTTDFIAVEPGIVYEVSDFHPTGGYFVVFYDANKVGKAYLSGYTSSILSIGVTSSWRYMRLSIDDEHYSGFDVRRDTAALIYYGEEAYKSTGLLVEVGTGKQFTTLGRACEVASQADNSTVIVYPGTYDLAQEFASVISSGGTKGIQLKNGINIIFLAGSYVTCLLDSTVASHEQFQPFYTPYDEYARNSNFTLNGLRMTASNCRYCVHDELATDTRPYVHNYINCQMTYSNTFANTGYNQCIGGGLGVNGYINIDGGYYNSLTSVSHGAGGYIPISYHNSSSANADNKIFIKNVYLAGAGHLRFGYYGTSQTITPIYISGCSFGAPIEKRAENDTALIDNFSITEWNNTLRQ